jgi:phage/plasmid-associated DNA primase
MQIELLREDSEAALTTAEVASFVRRALGLRFEMRFEGETEWWPIDAQDVAETLAGYYYNYGMHSCLEQMREGKELPSGLAFYRVRR